MVDGCIELAALGLLVVWTVAIGSVRRGRWWSLVVAPLGAVLAVGLGIGISIAAHLAGSPEGAVFAATLFTTCFRGLLLLGLAACVVGSIPFGGGPS